MLHYRLDAAPSTPQHLLSADLRALLAHVPSLSISLVIVGPPHRDPAVTVWVLSVLEAARPAIEQRFVPRWFGDAPAPLHLVGGVAQRPEWRWNAVLLPQKDAVPLASVLAAHWSSLRLDTHATARGCVARLWACGSPSEEACAAIREAGWTLMPLTRFPRRLHPLLLRGALLVGRALTLTLELGVPIGTPTGVLAVGETLPTGTVPSVGGAEPAETAEDATEVERAETEANIFPAELPPAEAPAAHLLAEAWQAAQQPPSAEEEDELPPPSAGDNGAEEEETLSPWPAGPGRLSPRQLEAVLERVLSDSDVAERGLTKNKLKAAGAGPDAEALLAWLDAAALLAEPSKPDDPVVRWREPRVLQLRDAPLLAARLRATPLPDEAAVALVRAAFTPVVGGP